MMKRARILRLCLSHFGVAVLCLLLGLAVVFRDGEDRYARIVGGGPALQLLYLQYVDAQRERGGYEQYRDALLDLNAVSAMAQENALISVVYDGKAGHVARMVNYARLSRLESAQGAAAEADRYQMLAVAECKLAEFDECKPETPKEFLELLEEFGRNRDRSRVRRDKEADENFWTGPPMVSLPPR